MQGNLLVSAVFVATTVLANVLQKKAALSLGANPGLNAAFFRGLALSPYFWIGVATYALALGSYIMLLTRVPLNIATSIAALNFVAVLIAARLVFNEPFPPLRYAGFLLIVAGIYVVGVTQRATPHP